MNDPPQNPTDAPGGKARRCGRPTKLTPHLVDTVAAVLREGNFPRAAAQAAGVSLGTFRHWMRLGLRFPGGAYGAFRRAVLTAEAVAETRAVAAVTAAGRDDPKYLCWFLERRFPQRWGRCRGELAELRREVRELRELVAATGPTPADGQRRPTAGPDPESGFR